jgi:hypothetical protein
MSQQVSGEPLHHASVKLLEHVMTLNFIAGVVAVVGLMTSNAFAQDAKTAIGAGVGGAAGAAIGQAVGGSTGAVVGGAVGGGTGAAVTTKSGEGRTGAIVGGAVGGGAGAAVGQSVGGKTGSIVGAGVGGAAGAVVGRNVQGSSVTPVIAAPAPVAVVRAPSQRIVVVDHGCSDKWEKKNHPGKGWAKGHYNKKGC